MFDLEEHLPPEPVDKGVSLDDLKALLGEAFSKVETAAEKMDILQKQLDKLDQHEN